MGAARECVHSLGSSASFTIAFCTMASLTTQSIGMVGAPLANTSHAAQLSRASQAGVQAGIQQKDNTVRAAHSATKAQNGQQRAIKSEPRPEGIFEEEDQGRGEQSKESEGAKPATPRINTVA